MSLSSLYPYHVALTRNVRQALVPASGSTVEIFVSGTGVSKQLYSDPDGQILLDQPFPVDIDGEANLWIQPGRIRVVARLDPVHEEVWEDEVCDCDSIPSQPSPITGLLKNEVEVEIVGTTINVPSLLVANTQGYGVTCLVTSQITGTLTGFYLGLASPAGMLQAFSKLGQVGLASGQKTGTKDIAINSPWNQANGGDAVITAVNGSGTGGTVLCTYWYLQLETTVG